MKLALMIEEYFVETFAFVFFMKPNFELRKLDSTSEQPDTQLQKSLQ